MSDWIRVRDSLPEDGRPVLISVKLFPRQTPYICSAYHTAKGWHSDDDYVLTAAPTHWMPMPDPPKEE